MSNSGLEIEEPAEAVGIEGEVDRSGERPQFGMRLVLEAITLVGIVAAASRLFNATSTVGLAIYGLTWLFGCWKTKRATLYALAGMYVPFVWVFIYPEPEVWNTSLVSNFPMLPGVVGALFLGQVMRHWIACFLSTMAVFFLVVCNARTAPDAQGAGMMLAFAFTILSVLTYLVVIQV